MVARQTLVTHEGTDDVTLLHRSGCIKDKKCPILTEYRAYLCTDLHLLHVSKYGIFERKLGVSHISASCISLCLFTFCKQGGYSPLHLVIIIEQIQGLHQSVRSEGRQIKMLAEGFPLLAGSRAT